MLTQRLFSSYLIHIFLLFSLCASLISSAHQSYYPFQPQPRQHGCNHHYPTMISPRRLKIEIHKRHQRPRHSAAPALLARKAMHQAERMGMLKKALAWNKIESQRQQRNRNGSPIFQQTRHYYLLLTTLPSPSRYEPTIIIIKSISHHIPQPPKVRSCATPTPVLPV